jgi:Zn-dependent protease
MENQLAPPPQPEWLPPQAPEPVHNEAFGAKAKRRGGGIMAALAAAAAKGKALLLLLPKIKLLTTGASAFVSIAAYSLLWGWSFAAGFVILLFVHEMGHVIQLRREGIQASAPMFVPFLGAVVMAKKLGDDAAAEARVGLAGPVLGTLGASVCLLIAELTNHGYWFALAYIAFLLNLFNLLPVTPLDGGRAMAALSPKMWFVGLALMTAVAILVGSPLIVLFLVIGAFDVYRRWKALRHGGEEQQTYYRVRARTRVLVAAVYLGLIAVLGTGMYLSYLPRKIA